MAVRYLLPVLSEAQAKMQNAIPLNFASVVQWQYASFPSWIREFDSPHSLQYVSQNCFGTKLEMRVRFSYPAH